MLVGSDLCAQFSAFCLPHTYCCILLWGCEVPIVPTSEGVSECAETFTPSQFLPQGTGLVPYPLWFSYFWFCFVSYVFCPEIFCKTSMCKCIFDIFLGRKVTSAFYSPAILMVLPLTYSLRTFCEWLHIISLQGDMVELDIYIVAGDSL